MRPAPRSGRTCSTRCDPFHHRHPGIAGCLLAAPVPVSVIDDGVHLARETLRLVAAVKSPEALVLVTDADRAALGLVEAGIPVVAAVQAATRNPARVLRSQSLGRIAAGLPANLVVDERWEVRLTVAQGEVAYRAQAGDMPGG